MKYCPGMLLTTEIINDAACSNPSVCLLSVCLFHPCINILHMLFIIVTVIYYVDIVDSVFQKVFFD